MNKGDPWDACLQQQLQELVSDPEASWLGILELCPGPATVNSQVTQEPRASEPPDAVLLVPLAVPIACTRNIPFICTSLVGQMSEFDVKNCNRRKCRKLKNSRSQLSQACDACDTCDSCDNDEIDDENLLWLHKESQFHTSFEGLLIPIPYPRLTEAWNNAIAMEDPHNPLEVFLATK